MRRRAGGIYRPRVGPWKTDEKFEKAVISRESTRDMLEVSQFLQSRTLNLVPLKDLAMRSFLSNLPRFQMAPQLIQNLSNGVKTDILEAITKVIPERIHWGYFRFVGQAHDNSLKVNECYDEIKKEDVAKMLPHIDLIKLLITPNLHQFDFVLVGGSVGFENRGFKDRERDFEVWQCLAATPENNLQSIRDRRSTRGRPLPAEKIMKYLVKFPNLKNLNLTTVKFSDADLHKLTTSCPNLEKITLMKSRELTVKGLETLNALPYLEEICIGKEYTGYIKKNHATIQSAFEMMPKLKIISDLEFDGKIRHFFARGYGRPFFDIPINPPQPYNLEQLAKVGGCLAKIPSHLRQLKEVHVECIHNNVTDLTPQILDQLPLLKSLSIHEPYRGYLLNTLELVGLRLEELNLIGSSIRDIDLFQVLDFCPNLEKLEVESAFRKENQQYSINPKKLKLKELCLDGCYSFLSDTNSEMLFWELLLAPQLQIVHLDDFYFTDPLAIIDTAEPYLQDLVELHTLFAFKAPKEFDVHNELISDIVKNCRKLKSVRCFVGAKVYNELTTLLTANVSPKWPKPNLAI
ncbi:uncharacterized protein LOC132196477 [Neocloeon triangulifer]|uniref:uncharacterized protein LOC132196477 n=1 Tax=Neocloeon triangulifer TaxID=2078957 RepID=UPI00286EDB8B|nr:uncharacterized protein LOC132196477 [Neocloeon triangulifer]XP_059475149.1 uncharacterized protein LOC132196477 [Neocloeon triangulifer]